jgi:hypothetical protein
MLRKRKVGPRLTFIEKESAAVRQAITADHVANDILQKRNASQMARG